ncbi:sensor histidine kinase [Pseudofulvibacter geojedonensis]|uniref:histidine kinase n=1 Tax=Pseudofulvibacter geojedonensis TaxID=1123758 RepID=A0ABW3I4L4_9FLAO
MNKKKYTWIFYLIAFTIVSTILVQFYWNYKNYQENKQRVNNEIQLSFDNAIEEYYADLAKEDLFTFVSSSNNFPGFQSLDSVLPKQKQIKSIRKKTKNIDFAITEIEITDSSKVHQTIDTDSIFINLTNNLMINDTINADSSHHKLVIKENNKPIKILRGNKSIDSLELRHDLNSIFISFLNKEVNYQQVDSLFQNQLNKKNIDLEYSIEHRIQNQLKHQSNKDQSIDDSQIINAKSTFIKGNEKISLRYTEATKEAFKRSSTGILLSFLLSLSVLSSLLYLLKVINKQKELAEIKNDLISNITHEFKTPITTVRTALEAIENFNATNDTEKTKKYLSISNLQLKKLHLMVEKLLETATLDSEKLFLKKEDVNLIDLLETITQKHQLLAPEKKLVFSSNVNEKTIAIDVFHFENAISNLIDNAIKYGGDIIEVNCNILLNQIEISISDNGTGISKNQQEKIFDKFYRVPKGNTHDVKGFGIGLYYTKKIVEKHLGSIIVNSNNNLTQFKISLKDE